MSIAAFASVIAAFVGALAGGLISAFRGVLELRRDGRRALNTVLWCQLDLWFELKRHDIEEPMREFLGKLADRMGISNEDMGLGTNNLDVLLEIMRQTLAPPHDDQLEVRYHEAVLALAPLDPILAYQLSGKTSIARFREQTSDYLSAVLETFGAADPQGALVIEKMNPLMRREVFLNGLKIIEEDIRTVAKRLGRSTRKEVMRLMPELEQRITAEREKEFEEVIERTVALMTELKSQLSFLDSAPVQPNA
jgi:hypothetical protein